MAGNFRRYSFCRFGILKGSSGQFIILARRRGISLAWTPSRINGIKELSNIAVGIGMYLIIRSLNFRIKNFTVFFVSSWNIVFVPVFLFAVMETLTGAHLPGGYTTGITQYGGFHPINYVPVSFFDNPNYFAFYLVTGILLNCIMIYRRINVATASFVIIASIFLLGLPDSKLSVYSVMVIAVVCSAHYILVNFKRKRNPVILVAGVSITAFVAVFSLYKGLHSNLISPSEGAAKTIAAKEPLDSGSGAFTHYSGVKRAC